MSTTTFVTPPFVLRPDFLILPPIHPSLKFWSKLVYTYILLLWNIGKIINFEQFKLNLWKLNIPAKAVGTIWDIKIANTILICASCFISSWLMSYSSLIISNIYFSPGTFFWCVYSYNTIELFPGKESIKFICC